MQFIIQHGTFWHKTDLHNSWQPDLFIWQRNTSLCCLHLPIKTVSDKMQHYVWCTYRCPHRNILYQNLWETIPERQQRMLIQNWNIYNIPEVRPANKYWPTWQIWLSGLNQDSKIHVISGWVRVYDSGSGLKW